MKSWLQKNVIEMYSIHDEGKSVAPERFIRNLKNRIYKYIISISKNLCIDKLDDIVNKCSNTYHRTIEMELVDVKPSMHFDFNKENKRECPKFKVVGNVRTSKHKNISAKGHVPNWYE